MIRYSFRKYSRRSFIPNFSLPTCIVMTSREGEEGTKESQDDYEADHEGKEPVRRKLRSAEPNFLRWSGGRRRVML